eukprot:TRINITY_DN16695_c0_g2_i1.p1 TRINITY_DN16695_c0_g2~~TRINITY_DN16695_c0_g2_i1.p1  ORF type:complete len:647 (+),score=187.65 TRINITY_DN16695_c0_g2_i1:174-2114(+)
MPNHASIPNLYHQQILSQQQHQQLLAAQQQQQQQQQQQLQQQQQQKLQHQASQGLSSHPLHNLVQAQVLPSYPSQIVSQNGVQSVGQSLQMLPQMMQQNQAQVVSDNRFSSANFVSNQVVGQHSTIQPVMYPTSVQQQQFLHQQNDPRQQQQNQPAHQSIFIQAPQAGSNASTITQAIEESLRQGLITGQLSPEVLDELIKSLSILQSQQRQIASATSSNGADPSMQLRMSKQQSSAENPIVSAAVAQPFIHNGNVTMASPYMPTAQALQAASSLNASNSRIPMAIPNNSIPAGMTLIPGIPVGTATTAASLDQERISNTPMFQAATTFGHSIEEFKDFSKMIMKSQKTNKKSRAKKVCPTCKEGKVGHLDCPKLQLSREAIGQLSSDVKSSPAAAGSPAVISSNNLYLCSECKKAEAQDNGQGLCDSCFRNQTRKRTREKSIESVAGRSRGGKKSKGSETPITNIPFRADIPLSERARVEQIISGKAGNLSLEQRQAFIQSYVDDQDPAYQQLLASTATAASVVEPDASSISSGQRDIKAEKQPVQALSIDLKVLNTPLPEVAQSVPTPTSTTPSATPASQVAATAAAVVVSANSGEISSSDAQQLVALLNRLPLSAFAAEDAAGVQHQLESFLGKFQSNSNPGA